MRLENFTPFTPATYISGKQGSAFVATVLVKGSLQMRPGQIAKPTATQPFPQADEFHALPEGRCGSLRYASDFVPSKPRADVLLAATAYRPAEQPKGTFRATVRVGSLMKQLAISGRRQFQGFLSASLVELDPQPSIPVTYEYTCGGPQVPANPLGMGVGTGDLPQIELFEQRIRAPGDSPKPAGFGPLPAEWEPRRSLLGHFSADYLAKAWPGLPADTDPAYFNAAPRDQQVAGYLRGDEEILLENLHSSHALYRTRLPGWRIVGLRENVDGSCELLSLVLDTLWINPDDEQVIVVWRGQTRVATPDALEVKHLGFLAESLDAIASEPRSYQLQIATLLAERDREFEPEPMPEPFRSEDAAPVNSVTDEADTIAELSGVMAEVAALRAAAELPEDRLAPRTEPPQRSAEAQATFAEIMARMEAEDRQQAEADEALRWTRARVLDAAAAKLPLQGVDLSGLDLQGCDLSGVDLSGAKLVGTNFSSACLDRAQLVGCRLEQARLTSASLVEADLSGACLTGAVLIGARAMGVRLVNADCSGAQMDSADFSRAEANGAIFRQCTFAAAMFHGARLRGACLSQAIGPQADFTGADLTGVVGDHCQFPQATFRQTQAGTADFSHSILRETDWSEAVLTDANLAAADWTSARVRQSRCDGLWLSAARVDAADFQGSSCVDLQCDGTSARRANFTGCDLTSLRGSQRADFTGASFRHVRGEGSVWENCVLEECDFTEAHLPSASFCHAAASRAKFVAADLREARFDHAQCQEAIFAGADLFQAVFAGVNLIAADLSDANCYAVEFLDARISKLRASRCNLQLTKLESWAITNSR